MEIKAQDVKQLREKTGAGMMECKKALQEAGGDFEKAEKILKELGLAAAAKRSGRATNEGRIFTMVAESKAGILELSCETDFVARNTDFIDLGTDLLKKIIEKELKDSTDELETRVKETISVLKENIAIRRFDIMPIGANETVSEYIHGEGRIGVLVKFEAEKKELLENETLKQLAFDTALHVAAFNPRFLTKEDVDSPYLKEQEEIFTAQAQKLGKPEKVLEGIVKGKLNKHFAEVCLLEQGFVKDDKQSVANIIKTYEKEIGGKVSISDYRYYRVGEEL